MMPGLIIQWSEAIILASIAVASVTIVLVMLYVIIFESGRGGL